MTVEPIPVRKTPWLLILLGVLGVLCLCAIVSVIAILAFLTPIRGNIVTEVPMSEAVSTLPVPTEATQEEPNAPVTDAAPAGTAVDIGENMTLTILNVTRPADDIVANGSVLNTTAPAGEEFMRVDVEVTCNRDPGTTCTFYPTVLKAVLSDGSTRDLQTFIEGVDDWDTSLEIKGGSAERGFLLFIVPKAETDLVLRYYDAYLQLP